MGVAGDLLVLFRDAFHGVQHQKDHIAAVHGPQGADDGIFFNGFVDLAFPTHAGGVDEEIGLAVLFHRHVDGVPGSAGHIADDAPGLADDVIEDGRFAHVGPADDGHFDHIFIFVVIVPLFGEFLHDGIQQVPQVQFIGSGDQVGFPDPQVVEFVGFSFLFGRIRFVHSQDHRLSGLAQQFGHFHIVGGDARTGVAHEQDHIRFPDGDFRLFPDGNGDGIRVLHLDTAGIHHGEFPVQPFGIGIETVTGHPGSVFNNGDPAVGEYIK